MGKIRYTKKIGNSYYTASGDEAAGLMMLSGFGKMFYWIFYGIYKVFYWMGKGVYLGCKKLYSVIKEKKDDKVQ